MKYITIPIIEICCLILFTFHCNQVDRESKFKSPYLGQKPPGITPEVFGPGIISTNGHKEFACTFTPDGKEFYFTRDGQILMCRLEASGWTTPKEASFNSEYMDHEPHVTADGKRLFFGSNRKNYGIWMTEKNEDGWGEPIFVGSGMFVSTLNNDDIFLTSFDRKDGSLVRTKLVNSKFSIFEYLKGGVDSPFNDWHPCIAPDGSYILFDSNRPGSHQGEGAYDLYVSFKQSDESWSDAKNVGEKLKIQADNICASISPDGKYLFYNSENYGSWNIYWVDTKVIHEMNPNQLEYILTK